MRSKVMGYDEFEDKVLKRYTKKTAKIRGSWGVYDAYKLIRKNGWYDIGRPVKEHEFYSIIRKVNKLLAQEILQGNTVKFPARMGRLELRKREAGVKMVDGKLRITYPIDWHKTLQLWHEDEEAHKKKILLRLENPYIYYVKYCRHPATYNNKTFYQFELNRFIKRALAGKIRNGEIDALW